MGGEVTGLAVAARSGLFDYWVDVWGVSNLTEEVATLGTSPASSWIMAETGGPPGLRQGDYDRRSPALLVDRMRGIKRAYVLHGAGDAFVPYSQARELFDGLRRVGVPASMYSFVSGPGGVQGNYLVPGGFGGAPTPYGPAAHDDRGGGWMGRALVDALLRGDVPDGGGGAGWREHVVDYTTGARS